MCCGQLGEIVGFGLFQAGSSMIPWQTIVDDPDQGLHEARLAGIDFYARDWASIWHLGASQTTDGGSEQLTHSGDIEWYDTLDECKARAERILQEHQVTVMH